MNVEFETYGCAMNQADSEFMQGILEREGFQISQGGVLVVNTCTVKTPTERKIRRRLRELKDKRVVVTGCLPSASPEIAEEFPEFSFLGLNLEDIPKAVGAAFKRERFVKIKEGRCRLEFPRHRMNPVVEILPIAEGCIGDCAYCNTRRARGKLGSYPLDLILEDIKKAVAGGVKEIWLTAQDTGAYGLDIGSNLPQLLDSVVKIPGEFRVRLGMMNPGHARKFLPELIKAYRNEKVYKFLHLPVQSGDNSVLKEMKRRYTVEDFKVIVREFRENFPGITISTDVILGFPTEDDLAFNKTMDMLKEVEPEVLNISRFWLRPGTKAEKMEQLPTRISKDRSREINSLFRNYALEKNRQWIGWEGEVLVSEKGSRGYTGRNFAYKPIVFKSKEEVLGKFIRVRIMDATYYDLRARISESSYPLSQENLLELN